MPTLCIWISMTQESPYKMTFFPSTPPASPSKEEECPSSDACSIVHALPPICSPHSAAPAETLRRLKGQIAHTRQGGKGKRERCVCVCVHRGVGGVRKKIEEEGKSEEGRGERAKPLHSNAIIVLHLKLVGFFCGSLACSFSLHHPLYFNAEANSHSRGNFYGTWH